MLDSRPTSLLWGSLIFCDFWRNCMAKTTMTRQSQLAKGEGGVALRPVSGGVERGQLLALVDETVLGRQPGRKGTVVDDGGVSRKHAVIRQHQEQGITVLEDLDSKNGTFVNGEVVRRKYLEDQDVIRIGDQLFLVEIEAPPVPGRYPIPELVGESGVMVLLKRDLELASPGDLPLLLLGETGTGKEVAARAVHRLGGRSGELIPVNCAGVPEALFESVLFGHAKGAFTGATDDSEGLIREAANGTLFLDEVGEMPQTCQGKLLRFLEDGRLRPVGGGKEERVDVRVIAATNAPVHMLERTGGFRSDLLARLEGIAIVLPPLCHRKGDIPMLLQHFSAELGWGDVAIDSDALEALLVHSWERNVRQLRHMVARWSQMVWCARTTKDGRPSLNLGDLTSELQEPLCNRKMAPVPPAIESKKRPAREELLAALDACDWSIQRVAEELGKDRKQVYRWMERYGINRPQTRASDGL
jgi:transcriptional regulator with GAF, ATPase, and Fis domain